MATFDDFYDAIKHKDLFRVYEWVSDGGDINMRTYYGSSPLQTAATNGCVCIVEYLLSCGADIHPGVLHAAAQNGEAYIFYFLLTRLLSEGRSLEEKNEQGETVLHAAVAGGYWGFIVALLGGGGFAFVDEKSSTGVTPLHLACLHTFTDIAALLIRWGANPSIPFPPGFESQGTEYGVLDPPRLAYTLAQAKSRAASLGPVVYVVDPVEFRPVPSPHSPHLTSLLLACGRGELATVEALVAMGAVLTEVSDGGWTPLHVAARQGHPEIVGYLLDAGGEGMVHMTSERSGETPFVSACRGGNVDVVQRILDAGGDAGGVALTSLLSMACRNNDTEVATLLITMGADPGNAAADSVFWPGALKTLAAAQDAAVEGGAGGRSRHGVTLPAASVVFDREDSIGHGATATVYRGTYNGGAVAIKEIHSTTPARVLEAEVGLLASLRHPNIVSMVGVVVESPLPLLVLELMEQGSLRACLDKLTSEVLSPTVAVEIALDVARGMAYLHSRSPPIIHRDLKSANVLLCLEGGEHGSRLVAKIGDFGLAKTMATSGLSTSVGTARWMAPEVLSDLTGERYTEKADVFSFGIILWELCTSLLPYADVPAGNEYALGMAVVTQNLRPDVGKLPVVSGKDVGSAYGALIRLVEECWVADPSARPSFGAIVGELVSKTTGKPQQSQRNRRKGGGKKGGRGKRGGKGRGGRGRGKGRGRGGGRGGGGGPSSAPLTKTQKRKAQRKRAAQRKQAANRGGGKGHP